jgi:DNA-binding XRE family transcriptional regulator
MKEKHVPQKKYVGDPESFKRLDATIQNVIEHDEKIRFTFEQEKLNLYIAGAIYQLRTQAGLTQAQLAKKAGIPQPFVARIENPESKKRPTLDTLAKIAHAFDKQIMIEIV